MYITIGLKKAKQYKSTDDYVIIMLDIITKRIEVTEEFQCLEVDSRCIVCAPCCKECLV